MTRQAADELHREMMAMQLAMQREMREMIASIPRSTDGQVTVGGQTYRTIGHAAAAHAVPGIRFPGNKAAFTSAALLAQQQDLRTHDAGLQALLLAILRAARHIRQGDALQLPDLKFTLNVATAPTERNKRFSVNMAEPFAERFSLVQSVHPDTCVVQWRVIRSDATVFYVTGETGGLIRDIRSPEEDPEGPRTRRIELD